MCVLPANAPVEWKSNFQNELTNRKFRSRNSLKFKGNTILWNPSLFFISNKFQRTINNFIPSNDHTIKELSSSWVVAMVTGDAHHCHLVVTCPVIAATVITIVIAGYLSCHVTQNQFSGPWNINETDRMLWLVSDAILGVTLLIYRSHRMGGHGTNLPR